MTEWSLGAPRLAFKAQQEGAKRNGGKKSFRERREERGQQKYLRKYLLKFTQRHKVAVHPKQDECRETVPKCIIYKQLKSSDKKILKAAREIRIHYI